MGDRVGVRRAPGDDRSAAAVGVRAVAPFVASIRADGLQVLRRELRRVDGSSVFHAVIQGASRAVIIDAAGPSEDREAGRRALEAMIDGVRMPPPASFRRRLVRAALPLLSGLPVVVLAGAIAAARARRKPAEERP